jgi:hypothetical protein
MTRDELEAEWLRLTREALPQVAEERGWPIRFDHCFQRVLLDHAFGGVWYDHVEGRPAYRRANENALRRAVEAGRAVLDGSADLRRLNADSLRYRGRD